MAKSMSTQGIESVAEIGLFFENRNMINRMLNICCSISTAMFTAGYLLPELLDLLPDICCSIPKLIA